MPFPADRLTIDRAAHQVILDGSPIDLTPTEYRLLTFLHERAGIAVTDQALLNHVWGPEWATDLGILQVQMSRLRRKLREGASEMPPLTRVRGYGYRLDLTLAQPAELVEWDVELAYDADLILRSVRPHLPFLGWHPDAVIGTPFMLAGTGQQDARRQIREMVRAGALDTQIFFTSFSADGGAVPTEALITLEVDADGPLTGLVGLARFYLRRPPDHRY